MRLPLVVLLLAIAACKRSGPVGPSAGDVCYKLEAAGVASKCQIGSRGEGGLFAAKASERVVFDLPSVPGKTGQVLRFKNAADHAEAVSNYEAAATLVGPHRYGSSTARIFVQLNNAAPADVGTKASAVVSAL